MSRTNMKNSRLISLKRAIAIPIVAVGTGLAALVSGCGGSSGDEQEPQEERINVHITNGTTNMNSFGETWVNPQCTDTNIPFSQYEANPSAYLLDALTCPYTPQNHLPYQIGWPDGGPGTGGDL